MIFAYGTNGLTDHRLEEALELLAETGYRGVALTLDHGHLDPYGPGLTDRVRRVRRQLDALGLAVTVETGARFILDPRHKHAPSLVSADGAERRIGFYRRAADIAADLGARALHLWSGLASPQETPGTVAARLVDGVAQVLAHAERIGMPLAFEPEPGMAVATLDDYARLLTQLDHHPLLGLTLDIGHCRCLEVAPITACVERFADRLRHVQIEDMRRGVHEHLPFGEGEIDVPPVLAALRRVRYGGLVSVELPRHGHAAHELVPSSLAFLRRAAAVPPGHHGGDPVTRAPGPGPSVHEPMDRPHDREHA